VSFELGGKAVEKTEFVDKAIPETPGGAPAGARWADITEGTTPAPGGALKKAEGVFGGKAKIIKKPSGGT
jgi:hypothetical protein